MFKLLITVVATVAIPAQAIKPTATAKARTAQTIKARTAECYTEYMHECVENIDTRVDYVEGNEFYGKAVSKCINEASKHANNYCDGGKQ